jgi:PleD family two-component response regulator
MCEIPSSSLYAADEFFGNQIRSSREETDSKEPRQNLPRILVVDDERRIADTLTEILEMAGFHNSCL